MNVTEGEVYFDRVSKLTMVAVPISKHKARPDAITGIPSIMCSLHAPVDTRNRLGLFMDVVKNLVVRFSAFWE